MKFSKKGDTGETSLLGGQRVPKFDPRPERRMPMFFINAPAKFGDCVIL